jgi:hypothetical protein
LSKIAKLLESEKSWTQGTMARNQEGLAVLPTSPEAVAFDLYGAIDVCYKDIEAALVKGKVRVWLEKSKWKNSSIHAFNDVSTHAEILAMVKELGI